MRVGTRIKGFKVHQDGRGKVTLVPIPYYFKRDASAKIRAKNSTKATPVRQGVLGLHWKGEK
jgi:hypothetical protein